MFARTQSNMDNKIPHRKTIRLSHHDYSENGAYFITICTKDKEHLLWENTSSYSLSPYGMIIHNELQKIDEIYFPNIRVEKFVVMSNHIHMFIMIDKDIGLTQFAPTISRIVKQFKGSVTKQIGKSIFQKSFFDRVIRDRREYLAVWKYIDENPLKPETNKIDIFIP